MKEVKEDIKLIEIERGKAMIKKLAVMMAFLLLILTACSSGVEGKIDKAKGLVKEREYEAAISIYEAIIEDDETVYEAHEGLAIAYLRDEEFSDAEEVLEEFFEVVKDHYQEDDSVDYDYWMGEIIDNVRKVDKSGERVGRWFKELEAPVIDLMDLPYDYDLDTPIVFDVPEGVDVYYTLDGSNPTTKDERYNGSISVEEEGEIILSVVAVNDYGIEGEATYTYLSVYTIPDAPTLTEEEGTYDAELTLFVEDYDYDTMDVYYTLDGSIPSDYGMYYYEEDGITLENGDYELMVQYYDMTTGLYSQVLTANYTINNPNALTEYTEFYVAVLDTSDETYNEVEYALYELYYAEENIDVTVYKVEDLDTLAYDLESGYADAYYGPATYVEDFAELGLLADVSQVMSMDDYEYYNEAYDAGLYYGDYYTMPVVIEPGIVLYVNSYDVDSTDIMTWDQLIDTANNGASSYNFLYPEDLAGYWAYSFYLGFGGAWQMDDKGNFILDRQPLIDAIQFAYDLPSTYGLGNRGMTYDTYSSAIESDDVTMVMSNGLYMHDLDYFEYYSMVGPMPLPNNAYTASVNTVDGLHINSQIIGNPNKLASARLAYKYLSQDYYVNYIASESNALPAIIEAVDTDLMWLNGGFENYENAINQNITVATTYQLVSLQEVMNTYMMYVFDGGMAASEAADVIISEVASYYE